MNLRLAIIAFGVVILLPVIYLLGVRIQLFNILLLLGTIAAMYVTLRILLALKKVNMVLKYAFAIIDVFLITYVISYTGGIKSPFYLLYILIFLYEGLNLEERKYIIFLIMKTSMNYP